MNTLGIVLPMGQSRTLLEKSGQWTLWQQELEFYQKNFDGVEFFEYQHKDWRRFLEALLLPIVKSKRFKRCVVLKAVHLTGAVPCLMAQLLYGIPYMLSYGYRYDEFAVVEKKWWGWLLTKILTPIAIKFASAVMAPTKELKRYVLKFGAKTVEVIPNGVNTQLFKGLKGPALPRQGRALSHIRILFVGRLERQKNLETLIKAISRMFKGPALVTQGRALISLQLVGAGGLKNELIKLANKLGVNLEIKGPVPNEKLPEVYRRADIFVLPSFAEGHPKALLEAMSCGVPCLASAIPGTTEIITHGRDGWLVAPTASDLTRGLKHLIENDSLRFQLGIEARRTIEKRFDKRQLLSKELTLLRSLRK